jgi:peptidoglycan/xylan/chitin deacetylase (PgdA/CDA1 family)
VREARAAIPVLLYHRVASSADDHYAVSPAAFAEHVQAILASNRTAVTVSQLADVLGGSRSHHEQYVAVTFDDGYADTADAVRSLVAQGLSATIYVTTGWIGRPGMLTPERLLALWSTHDVVELGAHTVSHPHLDILRQREMESEIAKSGDALRALGIDVRTFAYPHGAYDASVRMAVIRAGFSSAAAVKNALSHAHDDPWAIARYTVTSGTSLETVLRLLEGRGAPLAWEQERIRTRAWRLARRISSRAHVNTRVKR